MKVAGLCIAQRWLSHRPKESLIIKVHRVPTAQEKAKDKEVVAYHLGKEFQDLHCQNEITSTKVSQENRK